MSDIWAKNLSNNLRAIRETRHFTQLKLAELAGIPRATISNMESGAANPTLQALGSVAAALQVSIEELIGTPKEEIRHYRAEDLPTRKRGDITIRKIVPHPLPSLDIERMELKVGARMAGIPHRSGTREYLTCERGIIELNVSGETFIVAEGEVVVFRGDQRHSYYNRARTSSVGYSVLILSPQPM